MCEDRVTLAIFPYGKIQKCGCEGYYITFGYVTLRLSYEELQAYLGALKRAVEVDGIDAKDGGRRGEMSISNM